MRLPDMADILLEFLKPGPHHAMVPDIVKLGQIAAVLPVTNAAPERGFSALKRIKTRLRSLLKAETLDNCLMVSMETPSSLKDFNIHAAREAFFTQKRRRVPVNAA